jgi:hypothetical protein
MVAAVCARAGVQFECLTYDTGGRAAMDVAVARNLSSIARFKHKTWAVEMPSDVERERWQQRVGGCVLDSVSDLAKTVKKSYDGRCVVTGTAGEVGRGFYWRRADLDSTGLDPEQLVSRMGFKPMRLLSHKAEGWIGSFSADTPTTVLLDRAYIEQRLGSWAGPAVFGHDIPIPTFTPFNSALAISQLMTLDPLFRFNQMLPSALIEHCLPCLLSVPFNPQSFVRRTLKSVLNYFRS